MLNRKSSKLTLSFILFAALLLTIQSIVAAAPSNALKVKTSSFNMVFDGKTLVLPDGQYVFAVNGTSYVPLRFVSYALQKSVQWDAKKSQVTVANPSKQEAVVLKDYLTNVIAHGNEVSAKGGVSVQLTPKSVKVVVDGKTKVIPDGQSGYIVNGALYVPVRFMSEAVGTAIQWDPVKKQVSAESAAYRAEHGSQGNNGGTGGTGTGSNGGTNGGSTGGSTGGGGTGPVKPSYESITSNAQSRLTNLQNSCQASLMDIGLQYISTDDAKLKEKLKNQGYAKLDACTASFNTIVGEVETQLKSNGYSTAIIADYRKEFNSQVEAGKEIMKGMA
ncbi:stalk domain-containing protein [Paenibacillus sp. CF384]|uniref:stalk domain-containing protein n=1 Tax=Paenibacillus sp. CF384 TaxID=1884382 RepID=UPI00089C1D60|nr:stalk domain-containing protein [Paenibacillus sp. CF384]SDX27124.1 Copper amine oxidase N-terminal domain-containing protein [Paenibacillus sp. CF384]